MACCQCQDRNIGAQDPYDIFDQDAGQNEVHTKDGHPVWLQGEGAPGHGKGGGEPASDWAAEGGGSGSSGAPAFPGLPTRAPGDERVDFADGSVYVGQILDGKRHGNGTCMSADEQYHGQWLNDLQEGQGCATWHDGRVYEGGFREGRFHGFGCMEWHTKQGTQMYEGEYINDLKHGQGKFTWADGRIYDGAWYEGRRHGQASFTNTQGQVRVGIWCEYKLERWVEPP